jgi:glucokinase
VIHEAPNIAGFVDFPLADRMRVALESTVFVDRDTSMAAIGEALAGAARGVPDFVYVTVSTGLGGAIVSGGRMIRGATATAGEIGHLPVGLPDESAPRCGCGSRGCAEAYVAGRHLAERLGVSRADEVYAAARAGDARAIALVERAETALGNLAVGLTNMLNPSLIVVGGSIAEHEPDHVLDPMRRHIADRAFRVPAAAVRVVPAALGPDVGTIGAALAARERASGRGQWFL